MRLIAALLLTGTAIAAPQATIGAPHPIRIEDYARDGAWLVSCEAREDTDGKPGTVVTTGDPHGIHGDRLEPYLIWGSGLGDRIDAFANATPDGHWVAVVRGKALELHDAVTRKRVVLAGANVEDDASSDPSSRVTAFAANRLIYFRVVRGRDVVVIRELASGSERVVDVPGVVWRADIDPTGRWAKLRVVRSDTNHDGKLDWPVRSGWIGLRSCFQLDPHSAMNMRSDGDEPVTVWMDLTSGKLVEDATVVSAVGDSLLRTAADGSLTLDNAIIAPAACGAKILAISPAPKRVIAVCEQPGSTEGLVSVFGPHFSVGTQYRTSYKDPFEVAVASGRYACPRASELCVEVATGKLTALTGGVWGQEGDLVFTALDGDKFDKNAVWNLATGKHHAMADGVLPEVQGRLVLIGKERFDWTRDVHIGSIDERIYAVDVNGRVLVGNPPPTPYEMASGPLHWETR